MLGIIFLYIFITQNEVPLQCEGFSGCQLKTFMGVCALNKWESITILNSISAVRKKVWMSIY